MIVCHTVHLFSVFFFFFWLSFPFSFFLKGLFKIFIYLFLAALGLRYCAPAFSSCSKRGLFFVAVHGVLIAVASLVAEQGL